MIRKLFHEEICKIRGFYCLGFSRATILSYVTPRRVEAMWRIKIPTILNCQDFGVRIWASPKMQRWEFHDYVSKMERSGSDWLFLSLPYMGPTTITCWLAWNCCGRVEGQPSIPWHTESALSVGVTYGMDLDGVNSSFYLLLPLVPYSRIYSLSHSREKSLNWNKDMSLLAKMFFRYAAILFSDHKMNGERSST